MDMAIIMVEIKVSNFSTGVIFQVHSIHHSKLALPYGFL